MVSRLGRRSDSALADSEQTLLASHLVPLCHSKEVECDKLLPRSATAVMRLYMALNQSPMAGLTCTVAGQIHNY